MGAVAPLHTRCTLKPLYGSCDAVVLTGTRSLPLMSSGVPIEMRPPMPFVGATGGESGVHGGEVWFGAQIGGLIGVTTAHGGLLTLPMPGDGLQVKGGGSQGGLLTPAPGDGLHGKGVGPQGGLWFGGGESGQPEFGMQRMRIAVSISPVRTWTFVW